MSDVPLRNKDHFLVVLTVSIAKYAASKNNIRQTK